MWIIHEVTEPLQRLWSVQDKQRGGREGGLGGRRERREGGRGRRERKKKDTCF